MGHGQSRSIWPHEGHKGADGRCGVGPANLFWNARDGTSIMRRSLGSIPPSFSLSFVWHPASGAHHAWPDDTAALAGGGEPGCCGEKAADAQVRVRICLAVCIHAADRGVETLHIIAVVNGVRMESASPPSRYGKIRCRRASSMDHHGRRTARVAWTTGLLQAIQHCRRHTRQRWTVDELLTSRRVTHRSQRARLGAPCQWLF